MENKLDKLFRDKLVTHEEIPSNYAWDKLNERLVNNRKKIWRNRLAIAASIILLAGLGYIGFRSIDLVILDDSKVSSKSMSPARIEELENANSQKSDLKDNDMESMEEVGKDQNQPVVAEVKTNEKKGDKPLKSEIKREKKSQNVEVLAVVIPELEDKNIEAEIGEEEVAIANKDTNHAIIKTEELLAENIQIDQQAEARNEIDEVKTIEVKNFPQVKVIYKASKQSELVDSGRKNILDKGLSKITEFSDEHLLTAERKTKLRNTTEDVLALNFGKLINKSNKEIEN